MDIAHCLMRLVPGASFGILDNDYGRIEWQDKRPLPTLAECEAVWPTVQAETSAAVNNAALRAQLDALDARYGVRALTEAMDGDSTRLDWLKAEKAKLRAQFVGVTELVAQPDPEA